jgi:hypothetical protein
VCHFATLLASLWQVAAGAPGGAMHAGIAGTPGVSHPGSIFRKAFAESPKASAEKDAFSKGDPSFLQFVA